MKRFFAAILLGNLFLSGPTQAGSGQQCLESFLLDLDTLSASFEQSTIDSRGKSMPLAQGLLFLQRPGRVRWEYRSPYEQVVVADGQYVWIVDSDLEQVTQLEQTSALRGTAALLLTETTRIEDEVEMVDHGEHEDLAWLELVPRDQESQFSRILVGFNGKELRRILMNDNFNQNTHLRFYDIRRNLELSPALFEVVRPDGFDILTQ